MNNAPIAYGIEPLMGVCTESRHPVQGTDIAVIGIVALCTVVSGIVLLGLVFLVFGFGVGALCR